MLPFTSYLHFNQQPFVLLLVATLFYLIGVFAVTVLVNVPLNNKLDVFEIAKATGTTAKQMRNDFENRWNFWNNVGTVAALCSIFFVIVACVFNKAD